MLDLKALNESFDRINSIKTSGKLFEYFCEDCSESGIEKEDILDWLSEHEQLWNDCEKHFVQDPTWLSADELESFICEHEEACKDYAKAFSLSLDNEEQFDESCIEAFDKFLTEAKISPEDKHDSDLIRSIYAKINQKPRRGNPENRLTAEEKDVLKKYGINLAHWYDVKHLLSIEPEVSGSRLFRARDILSHDIDTDKANLADKARKTKERADDNKSYQPHFGFEKEYGYRYGDTISKTFSKDKKDLENIQNQSSDYQNRIADLEAKISRKKDYIEAARNGKLQGVTEQDIKKAEASIRIANAELEAIKKEKPYFDSERKKAINNFYKDRFGKTPKQEALSEGKVTLFCELENYSRYAFDTHRKVKVTGKDHLEALKKLVDNLNLYITSDIIEEEDYTFEDAIKFISNVNGDGCDWITKLTDNKGNTFIEEEAYEDDWEDLDEGKAFDFDKLNKKLHGNVRV